jgi:hypothetical protein
MKKLVSILCLLLIGLVGLSASRTYTIQKTLNTGDTYYRFPTAAFANDTIGYGDSVTFNLQVDLDKHSVVQAPLLYALFQELSEDDSVQVSSTIYYSQAYAVVFETSAQENYYYKQAKSTTEGIDYNAAGYSAYVIADSIQSSGLVYPTVVATRSVFYKVTVIPLKSGAAFLVRDFRFKHYLN